MKTIFEQGSFSAYQERSLQHAMKEVVRFSTQTTVFISHKHEDLSDLQGVLGFLEKHYNVKVYIDSRDSSMPAITSEVTANNIKSRIEKCDKFILLATNGAIESKWCNWELGFGDAKKYRDHIALFPMKPQGTYDSSYKGNEYMRIYPYICYFEGTERYKDGTSISKGYYVREIKETRNYITPLGQWFNSK